MQDAEIIAYAHSYDGYGWQFLDGGSGSDWAARSAEYADALALVPYRDYAALAVEFVQLVASVATTDGLPSALLEMAKATEDTEAGLREELANTRTELAAARRQIEKLTRQRNALLSRVAAAERLVALTLHMEALHGTEEVS